MDPFHSQNPFREKNSLLFAQPRVANGSFLSLPHSDQGHVEIDIHYIQTLDI
jgi:hypothetical protein